MTLENNNLEDNSNSSESSAEFSLINEEVKNKLLQKHPDFFTHPERNEDEIWLMNDYGGSGVYEDIPFQSKRKGTTALDRIDGTKLSTQYFPVFIKIGDYLTNLPKWRATQSKKTGAEQDWIEDYLDKPDGNIE